MAAIWSDAREFIESGGDTMWAIFATTFIMWVAILERLWFVQLQLPSILKRRFEEAKVQFLPGDPWNPARAKRMVSESRLAGEHNVWLVRTMVALCPLLGLLGTVLGMLEVFDVMAISGNGNPRAMAAGVSQATITTLAGMASALSGLFFAERLGRKVEGMIALHRDYLGELVAQRVQEGRR